ncbi:MAG: hypothetical protein CVV22_12635 [Ignavibacteriae bacterium HGW-Ignavibacteriae-1]|nr:MAG: hypothetical protein CVV22_12635 [Ignavibacteriae bacterium HGW-Ignavibacteriae-1]
MKYSTKRFKSWGQYVSFINNLTESWCFRGQSNSDWDLKTSLERTDFYKRTENIEKLFLMDFQRGAKNYLSEKEMPDNLLEWLALMQHHGAPTRLLDFTKSPYIAAYFAFENAYYNDNPVAIWCINYRFLTNFVERTLNLKHDDEFENARFRFSDEFFEKTRRKFTESDYEKLFYSNDQSLIIPIEPFKMNKRYALQQSIFISLGNSYETFMEQLDFVNEDLKKIAIKIYLPSSIKNEVLRELQKMNIYRASIFPDLDGYAMSLKMQYNSMSSLEDIFLKYQKFKKNGVLEFLP